MLSNIINRVKNNSGKKQLSLISEISTTSFNTISIFAVIVTKNAMQKEGSIITKSIFANVYILRILNIRKFVKVVILPY